MPGPCTTSLAWSPDGKKIAFIEKSFLGDKEREENKLSVMDNDGKNKKELIRSWLPYNDSPRWSPDSRKIAFVSTTVVPKKPNIKDICIIDVDNLNVTNLTGEKTFLLL